MTYFSCFTGKITKCFTLKVNFVSKNGGPVCAARFSGKPLNLELDLNPRLNRRASIFNKCICLLEHLRTSGSKSSTCSGFTWGRCTPPAAAGPRARPAPLLSNSSLCFSAFCPKVWPGSCCSLLLLCLHPRSPQPAPGSFVPEVTGSEVWLIETLTRQHQTEAAYLQSGVKDDIEWGELFGCVLWGRGQAGELF